MGGKGGRKRVQAFRSEKELDLEFAVPKKLGGGLVRMSVDRAVPPRYSFAYINPRICSLDNGRVLGYDNRHGDHHRHFMGIRSEVTFTSVDESMTRFEIEWFAIALDFSKGG